MHVMPKKIDPELKARAVRLVMEHRGEYPTATAAVLAVARQVGVGKESLRRWVAQAEVGGCPEFRGTSVAAR
jgi:transposase-like protein